MTSTAARLHAHETATVADMAAAAAGTPVAAAHPVGSTVTTMFRDVAHTGTVTGHIDYGMGPQVMVDSPTLGTLAIDPAHLI